MSSAGYCRVVDRCNSFLRSDSSRKDCRLFIVEGRTVGFIRPDVLPHIQQHPDVFTISNDSGGAVHLHDSLKTAEERSAAVATVLEEWRRDPKLLTLKGWRDEVYDVKPSLFEPALLKMERAATCLFGTIQCGCHINGYTINSAGETSMWISQRSPTKQTYPGMLDQLVAGGLTSGLSYLECAKKECQEEASIPDKVLQNLTSVGSVSYFLEDGRGLFPETEYVFDLLLPEDFTPKNADGEVQSFQLVSVPKVKELIKDENFKPNCALIALDFLMRHGFITPDDEPKYSYLMEMSHIPLHLMFGVQNYGRL